MERKWVGRGGWSGRNLMEENDFKSVIRSVLMKLGRGDEGRV